MRDHGVESDVFTCSYDGEGVEEDNKRHEQDWQWSSWLILAAHAVVFVGFAPGDVALKPAQFL